jgi:putative hydrolase of the HAD superfamily
MLRYLLLDLDNTVYSQSCGLWEAIGERIDLYMMDRLGVHHSEVTAQRDKYMNEFGTTLNALRHYHGVDPDDFLAFVHDLPLGKYLAADSDLDGMLGRLPLGKVIFTNADALHARRVLARLGISHHFERIIDIRTLEFVNKPDRRAYLRTLQLVGARPEECIFVDDCSANLAAAKNLGMITVLICDGGMGDPAGADYQIGSICELEPIISELMRPPEQ